MNRTYTPEHPIVLGLHGRALTGKTVTANGIAPMGPPKTLAYQPITWDHLFYALPIYRMATAKQKIEGVGAEDRIKYEIHATLLELFGGSPLWGAPPYDELIDMVNTLAAIPAPPGYKPRTFLQQAGTLCRGWDPDCFIKWMNNKITTKFATYLEELRLEELEANEMDEVASSVGFGVVVSDIRFENEARLVTDRRNGVLVKLWAREDVLQERSMKRDGRVLSKTQASHESENQEIPEELFDYVLDTSDMSVSEQIVAVKKILANTLKGLPNAAC